MNDVRGSKTTMPKFELFQSHGSALDFFDYRSQSNAFSDMAGIERGQFNLTGDRQPERIPGMRIAANMFRLLGIAPVPGRAFTEEEEQWGRHREVILSEPLWKSHFSSDGRILGKQLELDGEKYTVAGVARPMLGFMSRSELWLPLAYTAEQIAPNQRGLFDAS